jgi:hypothetical protein
MGETTITKDARSGRRWARALLGTGAGASLAGNLGHTYLPPLPTSGTSALGWRIYAESVDYSPHPFAVAWSALVVVAAFLALESFARIPWRARIGDWLVKTLGLGVIALVALVVSYRHLAGLLTFLGEDGVIVAVGPLVPDGMMLLGTAGLLLTRGAIESAEPRVSLAARVANVRAEAIAVRGALAGQGEVPEVAQIKAAQVEDAPTETVDELIETTTRTARRTTRTSVTAEQRAQVVDLLKNTSQTATSIAGTVFGAGTHPNKITRLPEYSQIRG